MEQVWSARGWRSRQQVFYQGGVIRSVSSPRICLRLGDGERVNVLRVCPGGDDSVGLCIRVVYSIPDTSQHPARTCALTHVRSSERHPNDRHPMVAINAVSPLHVGATAIAAGRWHSMVMKQNGTVWTVGHNDYGQLGDGKEQGSCCRVTFFKGVSSGQFDTMVWTPRHHVH